MANRQQRRAAARAKKRPTPVTPIRPMAHAMAAHKPVYAHVHTTESLVCADCGTESYVHAKWDTRLTDMDVHLLEYPDLPRRGLLSLYGGRFYVPVKVRHVKGVPVPMPPMGRMAGGRGAGFQTEDGALFDSYSAALDHIAYSALYDAEERGDWKAVEAIQENFGVTF